MNPLLKIGFHIRCKLLLLLITLKYLHTADRLKKMQVLCVITLHATTLTHSPPTKGWMGIVFLSVQHLVEYTGIWLPNIWCMPRGNLCFLEKSFVLKYTSQITNPSLSALFTFSVYCYDRFCSKIPFFCYFCQFIGNSVILFLNYIWVQHNDFLLQKGQTL